MRILLLTILFFSIIKFNFAQLNDIIEVSTDSRLDSLVIKKNKLKLEQSTLYKVDKDLYFSYQNKFKPFAFVKHAFQDLYYFPKASFKKENLPAIGAIIGSTALLMIYDDKIIDAAQWLGRKLNIPGKDNKQINVSGSDNLPLNLPADWGYAMYFIGDGITELSLNLGFYIYGGFKNDSRALQTASQLSEGLITVGLVVQTLKRLTGHESPFKQTSPRGKWDFFPSFKKYNSNVPKYDAYPSGHLATAMMAYTIITSNYPEYKFIKPLGITLMSLLSYQMLNNGVHWASDYPLALGIGYVLGKLAVKRSRKLVKYLPDGTALRKKQYFNFMPKISTQGYQVSLTYNF